MGVESILAFVVIVFFIAVIPGPNALLVLSTALTQRKLFAMVNILGVSLGFLFHAYISANGMSLVLSQTPWAFQGLKWIGVGYLIWLGYNHFKVALKAEDGTLVVPQAAKRKMKQHFVKGLLTNLLNPKIVLFYLSIFPQFVDKQAVMRDSLMLGALQAAVVASWFMVVILMAGTLKQWLTQKRTAKWMNFTCGIIFVGFSLQLALFQL